MKEETKEALFILSAIASIIGVGIIATKALKEARASAPPKPAPQPFPNVFAPEAPPPPKEQGVVTTQQPLVFLTDPVSLVQGSTYRAKLGLGKLELLVATKDLIAKQFEALGFDNVTVFENVSELPSDWPQETMVSATPSNRWVQGIWNRPSASIPKPPQIQLAWMVA